MRLVQVVLGKELSDHVRDRRSVMTALLFPILGPALFAMMFTVIAGWMREDRPVKISVVGAEQAPNLIAFLKRAGAEIDTAPADYEQKIQDGELDVVLVVPPEYGPDFEAGRPATVKMVVDNSRNSARVIVRRTEAILQAYSGTIANLRLLARGVSPDLARAVSIDEVDLATSEKMAANVLNMVPMFLLLAALMGGMHLAIDATAGERERGSLEPLLVNPISRSALVTGKWLATVVATLVTVLLTLIGFKIAIGRVPLEDLGVRAQFGPDQMMSMLAVLIPLALMAASLQLLISTYARSFKEAQSYVQMLTLIPVVPATLLSLSPIKPQLWMMGIPFLGQNLLVTDLMRGEGLNVAGLGLSIGGAAVVTAVCLAAASTIIYGRLPGEMNIWRHSALDA